MSNTMFKKALCAMLPLLGALGISAGGCAASTEPSEDDHLGAAGQKLTEEQCNYFAVNGKVQICHHTSSATKPYTIVKISEQACINAHALHAGDYVAVGDPTCQGLGCLPEAAPCDATVPCCDGLSCVDGTCAPDVADPCAAEPCQNGGSCSADGASYTCSCQPGTDGANCELIGYSCSGTNNPCTSANIEAGLFFFPNADPANYVECSQLGDCYIQTCAPGVWSQDQQQCI